MTPAAENLRVLLGTRDIDGFLTALEAYRQQHSCEPVVTALTQRVFPPLLRAAFQEERLLPTALARLYRMVRSGQLVLVEDDLLGAINLRIDDAIREVEPATVTPVPPLIIGEDVRPKDVQWSPPSMPGGQRLAATEMKRIAVVSTFRHLPVSVVMGNDYEKLMQLHMAVSAQMRKGDSLTNQEALEAAAKTAAAKSKALTRAVKSKKGTE